jgi:hypothetical protein
MGLRDYLASLAAGVEGVESGVKSLGDMRKRAELEAFAAEAPGLLESGNFSAAASRAAGVGEMGPMTKLFDSKLKAMEPPKPGDVAFSEQDIITQGFEPAIAKQAAKLPFDQQKEFLANVESKRSNSLQEREFAEQQRQEQRRLREEKQKQRNAAGKRFADLEKSDAEERRAIEKVEASLKTNTLTGDAIVLNFIARNMAGEKGPLAEGDIRRLIGRSFEGDVKGAENYLASLSGSNASAEQRKTYRKMLELAKGNYGTWKKGAVAKTFAQAIEDNPELVANGKPDKQLELKAKRLGYEGIEIDENGAPVLIVGKRTAPQNPINPETGAPDIDKLEAQVSLISNPKIKAWAEKQIAGAKKAGGSGKPIDPAKLSQILQTIKPHIPGN